MRAADDPNFVEDIIKLCNKLAGSLTGLYGGLRAGRANTSADNSNLIDDIVKLCNDLAVSLSGLVGRLNAARAADSTDGSKRHYQTLRRAH